MFLLFPLAIRQNLFSSLRGIFQTGFISKLVFKKKTILILIETLNEVSLNISLISHGSEE